MSGLHVGEHWAAPHHDLTRRGRAFSDSFLLVKNQDTDNLPWLIGLCKESRTACSANKEHDTLSVSSRTSQEGLNSPLLSFERWSDVDSDSLPQSSASRQEGTPDDSDDSDVISIGSDLSVCSDVCDGVGLACSDIRWAPVVCFTVPFSASNSGKFTTLHIRGVARGVLHDDILQRWIASACSDLTTSSTRLSISGARGIAATLL